MSPAVHINFFDGAARVLGGGGGGGGGGTQIIQEGVHPSCMIWVRTLGPTAGAIPVEVNPAGL